MPQKEEVLLGKALLQHGALTRRQVEEALKKTDSMREMGLEIGFLEVLERMNLATGAVRAEVGRFERFRATKARDKVLARLAVKNGMATPQQVEECFQLNLQAQKEGREPLGVLDLMVERGTIGVEEKSAIEVLARSVEKKKGSGRVDGPPEAPASAVPPAPPPPVPQPQLSPEEEQVTFEVTTSMEEVAPSLARTVVLPPPGTPETQPPAGDAVLRFDGETNSVTEDLGTQPLADETEDFDLEPLEEIRKRTGDRHGASGRGEPDPEEQFEFAPTMLAPVDTFTAQDDAGTTARDSRKRSSGSIPEARPRGMRASGTIPKHSSGQIRRSGSALMDRYRRRRSLETAIPLIVVVAIGLVVYAAVRRKEADKEERAKTTVETKTRLDLPAGGFGTAGSTGAAKTERAAGRAVDRRRLARLLAEARGYAEVRNYPRALLLIAEVERLDPQGNEHVGLRGEILAERSRSIREYMDEARSLKRLGYVADALKKLAVVLYMHPASGQARQLKLLWESGG